MTYNQTFKTLTLCFHKSTCKQNHKTPGIYTNNGYTKVIKSIKMTSNSNMEQTESKENIGRQSTNFPKL